MILIFPRILNDYMWSCGLLWYPFILLTPVMCCFLSFVSQYLEKIKATNFLLGILKKIGIMSFELFLTHVLIFDIARTQFISPDSKHFTLIWIGVYLISFPFALLLNKFSGLIAKKLFKSK